MGLYLWRDGEPADHVAEASCAADGSFSIETRIPARSGGPRWWRIAPVGADARDADKVTMPAQVGP